jgi:SAM-dependent methyltransferase
MSLQKQDPILPGLVGVAAQQAFLFSVTPAVHPGDHILNFLLRHTGFASHEESIAYYFSDGRRSAEKFMDLVRRNLPPRSGKYEVLEFASGYGCVTRHLLTVENISLCSVDIHPEAIEFLRREMGAVASISSAFPEALDIPAQFDVAFALSFFSHMPITTWSRWLVRLTQAVKPGGIIVFTTHGRLTQKLLGNPKEMPEVGFWFSALSEQIDLPAEDYGLTIVSQEFVQRNIRSMSGVELLESTEGFWWEHQDVYVLRKTG